MLAYRFIVDADAARLNADLRAQYLQHAEAADMQRSHYIQGRYENIYYSDTQAPALPVLRQRMLLHAGEMLGRAPASLRTMPWFNAMPPGSVTTWHTHEEDDELLSGVYYVDVPEHSGDLLLRIDGEEQRLTPAAGMFIFFSPELPHAVAENRATQLRLSVGFNIGSIADTPVA